MKVHEALLCISCDEIFHFLIFRQNNRSCPACTEKTAIVSLSNFIEPLHWDETVRERVQKIKIKVKED